MADFTAMIALNDRSRVKDLSMSPYTLATGFVPPTAAQTPIIGASSSLNPYGGSDLTGTTSEDFEFSFNVHIQGSSSGEVELALKDINDVLNMVGDKDNPLYFEIRAKAPIDFYPVLGQWNAPKRLEIVSGLAYKSENYFDSDMRERGLPNCAITLILKPYPVGINQLCGLMGGGFAEDFYGHPLKRVRGVSILPALTNFFTNPDFSWYTNPTAGWSLDSGLDWDPNYDKQYILYGNQNIVVFGTAANLDFYQSVTLTVATHSIDFLVKKRDSSVITTANCQVYYAGSAISTTFYSLGDGWYWGFGTFTGQATPQQAGIRFQSDVEIFVGCAALYLASVPVHPGFGDLEGWTWSGTHHASTSTCLAGRLSWTWNGIINPAQGAITLTWIPPANSSAMTGAEYDLLDTADITWKLYWDGSAGRFKFTDNAAHTTQSAVVTFSAFTPVVIHLAWGAGQAAIYINGALSGSAGTYSIPTTSGGRIYLGSDAVYGSVNCYGVFTQFTVYKQKFTATQVADDYPNIQPLAAARERVDWIFFQGDEPDGLVYAVNDTNRDNWASFHGVPGDAPAITRMAIQTSAKFSVGAGQGDYLGGCFLSRLLVPVDYPLNGWRFQNYLYSDLSGTADVTNSSGGAYQTITSIGSTPTAFDPPTPADFGFPLWDLLAGQEFAFLVRVKDSVGANLLMRIRYHFGTDTAAIYSDWQPIATSSSYFFARLTRKIGFKDPRRHFEGYTVRPVFPSGSKFTLEFKYSSGSGDVSVDFYCFVTTPTLRIWSTSTSANLSRFLYDSKNHNAAGVGSTDALVSDLVYVEGGPPFELVPDQVNYVISIPADTKRTNMGPVNAPHYLTYPRTTVVPRFLMT